MDYGDLLRRAWNITWKNKGLWILGILAGCTGNSGNPSQGASYQGSGQEFPGFQRTLEGIPPETLTLIVAALVLIGLVLAAVFIVLGTLGQAGLIAGFSHAEEQGSVTLSKAWSLGLTHFWRLLGVSLVAAAGVFLVALVVGGLAVLGTVATLGLGLLCLIPLLCLLIPAALLLGVYLKLVQNGVVVENLGVLDAFRRAWQLGRANLGPVVVVGLILILVSGIAGLIMAAPLLVLAVPAMVLLASGQPPQGTLVVGLVCGAIYLPVLLVASGILQTFVSGSWTLTYRRMAGIGTASAGAV